MPKKDGRLEASDRKTDVQRRFRFLPGDLLIILVILVFCVVFWLGFFFQGEMTDKKAKYVRITLDGQVILESALTRFAEPVEYSVVGEHGTVVIYLSSEEVYVKESSCEDQICVKTGSLKHTGDGAVCLPNRLVVQIVGGSEETGEPDAVSI